MNKSAHYPDFLYMGAFGRPHGLKGEISLQWHGDALPAPGQTVFYGDEKDSVNLETVRLHNGRILAALKGFPDRTQVERLTGKKIFMRRQDLPPLEDGEAYVADLIGARILLEDGTLLGLLDHLEYPAGQEVWAIKTPAGEEILFPARTEFIAALNLDKKEAIISPPPGLVEIYRA